MKQDIFLITFGPDGGDNFSGTEFFRTLDEASEFGGFLVSRGHDYTISPYPDIGVDNLPTVISAIDFYEAGRYGVTDVIRRVTVLVTMTVPFDEAAEGSKLIDLFQASITDGLTPFAKWLDDEGFDEYVDVEVGPAVITTT